ncbi:unnamed protein product [Paramecium sonneborni]|uniref:Uncharacterized protein n=1 Tax=Paramecium sonneborni TaxID=65129 RepID=A0A8S1K8J5_9CILI|nr:unnamed protein product [Paramecium sonneborni]
MQIYDVCIIGVPQQDCVLELHYRNQENQVKSQCWTQQKDHIFKIKDLQMKEQYQQYNHQENCYNQQELGINLIGQSKSLQENNNGLKYLERLFGIENQQTHIILLNMIMQQMDYQKFIIGRQSLRLNQKRLKLWKMSMSK